MPATNRYKKELAIFKASEKPLHTAEAIKAGIHPRTLYAMKNAGVLDQIDRGLYIPTGESPLSPNIDLVSVAVRARKGVICLISALSFHELTTQIPHEIHVALPFGAEKPRITHPRTHFYWFKEPAYSAGKKTTLVNGGVSVWMYSPEKTIADCFKFRNRIGPDVAIEALKLYLQKKRSKPDELLKYAKICRVERIIRPYLEALL